ncbi:MAG: hypothetical protein Q8R40_01985 [bacterium]|nr:hypothetical protein [bacterium]
MSPCNDHVSRRIEEALTTLFKEIPDLRIGSGANGDYCDQYRSGSYVTKRHKLTTDIYDICQFVRTLGKTDGGDLPECYEQVLAEAQLFGWRSNAVKLFILIADDVPHGVNDPQNRSYHGGVGLDWRREADKLAQMGVVIYPIQCLSKGRHADAFYRELAQRTGGHHLRLDQFSEAVDLIMAVCIRQMGDEKFQDWNKGVEKQGRVSRTMDENFAVLGNRRVSDRFSKNPRDLESVLPGRFQILYVNRDISIRDFVEEYSLEFKAGKGFYEFTKTELIQEKKEVVLRHKDTGDMFTGRKARAMIGLGPNERAKVKPKYLETYDVFVQSTSYNRKLIGGTRFLYEVDLDR